MKIYTTEDGYRFYEQENGMLTDHKEMSQSDLIYENLADLLIEMPSVTSLTPPEGLYTAEQVCTHYQSKRSRRWIYKWEDVANNYWSSVTIHAETKDQAETMAALYGKLFNCNMEYLSND